MYIKPKKYSEHISPSDFVKSTRQYPHKSYQIVIHYSPPCGVHHIRPPPYKCRSEPCHNLWRTSQIKMSVLS